MPTPTNPANIRRSSSGGVAFDVLLQGKKWTVTVFRDAIEDDLRYDAKRAAAMTDVQRNIFVRNNLARLTSATERKLGATGQTGGVVILKSGEL